MTTPDTPEPEAVYKRFTVTYPSGTVIPSFYCGGATALSPHVPDRAGTVDSLPFGTATVHVRDGAKPGPASGSIIITEAEIEAARKGRTSVRQGSFTRTQEVQA